MTRLYCLIMLTLAAPLPMVAQGESEFDVRMQFLSNWHNSPSVDTEPDWNVAFDERFEPQARTEYPDPTRVLYRSMILPGWGQVTNRQTWKVPVIYALFAGLGYYTYDLSRQYRGFRAAYYNEIHGGESDFRYGPTPDFVPEGMPAEQMRTIRDNLRNSRDLSYVYIALAYGLNILDAYVFAHMRSFDVSDDLSANTVVSPAVTEYGTPGIRLRVDFLSGRR